MIIWGWRTKLHDHGATIAATCPRCHNSVVLHHVQIRKWFTLFFITVIPLGKGRRVLMCPVCRWGRDVTKEAIALTEEMATITQQWKSGELDDGGYGQRVEAYWAFASPGGLSAEGDGDVPVK